MSYELKELFAQESLLLPRATAFATKVSIINFQSLLAATLSLNAILNQR